MSGKRRMVASLIVMLTLMGGVFAQPASPIATAVGVTQSALGQLGGQQLVVIRGADFSRGSC